MKILVAIKSAYVAPRFDMASEVAIFSTTQGKIDGKPRIVLLPGPSSDELCGLILKEEVSVVICGGIEEEHYQYLEWKKIKVIDRVIGKTGDVLRLALADELRPGAVVRSADN